MSNNLDHLFKNALRNRKCEPPPHIWENIETSLCSRRRKLLLWWTRSVAAVALVAAAIWLLQLRNQETQEMQWVKISPPPVEQIPLPEKAVSPTTDSTLTQASSAVQPITSTPPVFKEPIITTAIFSERIDTRIETKPVQLALKEQPRHKGIIPDRKSVV